MWHTLLIRPTLPCNRSFFLVYAATRRLVRVWQYDNIALIPISPGRTPLRWWEGVHWVSCYEMDIALLPVAWQVLRIARHRWIRGRVPGHWSGLIAVKQVNRLSYWNHCLVVCLSYSGLNCSSIVVSDNKNWFSCCPPLLPEKAEQLMLLRAAGSGQRAAVL